MKIDIKDMKRATAVNYFVEWIEKTAQVFCGEISIQFKKISYENLKLLGVTQEEIEDSPIINDEDEKHEYK